MADWTYFNPVKVVFAPGALSRLADHVPFQRVVLVTSPGFTRRGVTDKVRQSLGKRLVHVLDDVKPNPDVRDIDDQATRIRALKPGCILVLGGGSAMDTGKALARLLTQPAPKTLASHFRDGDAWQDAAALPVVTIPTTSGTGSEVTPFATVWDFERKKKYSVTGDDLFSHTAILDPELTAGLPVDVTVSSGLDTVSHALESAWNRRASPVTLGFVTASLRLSLPALLALQVQPGELHVRGAMMQASLLAGMAISQTRTALAHSISYPLTTAFGLPHGIACSFTLPVLMRFNAEADDGRLQNLAVAVGYDNTTAFSDGLASLFRQLKVADLFTEYVADAESVMVLTEKMFAPGRADNNLRTVDGEDIAWIVGSALRQIAEGYATE